MKNSLILTLFFALLFVSCSKDEQPEPLTDETQEQVRTSLSLDTETISFTTVSRDTACITNLAEADSTFNACVFASIPVYTSAKYKFRFKFPEAYNSKELTSLLQSYANLRVAEALYQQTYFIDEHNRLYLRRCDHLR